MTIVVIGGSGLIGSKLVKTLQWNGHDVIAASPSAEAFMGAHVVVDVTNSPSFEDSAMLEFLETCGRDRMAVETLTGVRHHVALSVVGIDRNSDNPFFRAKVLQEELIKASGVPYTIVRSTQFYESVGTIAEGSVDGEAVRVSPALVQPIASDDVVAVLADVALGAPVNDTIEIAGPEQAPLDEMVREFLISRRDGRPVISDVHAGYFGLELNDRSLTPSSSPRIGLTRFGDWLGKG